MANKINTLIGSDISIVGNISYEGVIHGEANVKGSLIANKERESKLFINKLFAKTEEVGKKKPNTIKKKIFIVLKIIKLIFLLFYFCSAIFRKLLINL